MESLVELRKAGSLQDFAQAMKRVVNILPKQFTRPVTKDEGDAALLELSGSGRTDGVIDQALLTEKSEKSLFKAASEAADRLLALGSSGLGSSVEILHGLVPEVNSYFDEVLVNCEDEAVKKNRIAFLLAFSRISGRFCNFLEIVADQG